MNTKKNNHHIVLPHLNPNPSETSLFPFLGIVLCTILFLVAALVTWFTTPTSWVDYGQSLLWVLLGSTIIFLCIVSTYYYLNRSK